MPNLINSSAVEITNENVLSTHNYNNWNCDYLTDYIVQTHHEYVKNAILQIKSLASEVVDSYGETHSELAIIQSLFKQISNEMLLHLKKEELVLFPYIKKLNQAKSDQKHVDRPGFGSVKVPARVMETEHETAGIIMQRLSKLSSNYTPPDDASHTFRVLYEKLKEFDDDLHVHVHLENDILHPKAIALEKLILAS